jgi:hypothetical protein
MLGRSERGVREEGGERGKGVEDGIYKYAETTINSAMFGQKRQTCFAGDTRLEDTRRKT